MGEYFKNKMGTDGRKNKESGKYKGKKGNKRTFQNKEVYYFLLLILLR